MSVSDEELRIIRSSFDRLRSQLERHSLYFYERLFHRAPEMRELFRDDIEGQGMKFMRTLGVILDRLDDLEAAAGQYADLGRTHAILGIKPEQFAPMEEALIDTLRHALGDDFSDTLETAWRRAYRHVADNMIRLGGIDADKP